MKLARFSIAGFVAAAAIGASTLPAMAQPTPPPPTVVNPPTPSKPDEPPAILSLLATLVIVGAVAAPGLLNPKRGHQD
ncbi:MAG: hypothetical protein WC718_05540 [Phycisphaerales bacterium]